MAINGFGIWSLVVQQLTDRFMDLLTLYWVTRWFPRFRFSATCLADMFSYGWKILGTNLLQFASTQLDRFLIGQLLGVAALGVYVVGRRLVEVILGVMTSIIGRVALSIFAQLQGDKTRLLRGSIMVARTSAFVSLPLFVFLMAFGQQIVDLVFGENWLQAGVILQSAAAAGLIRTCLLFLSPLLKAINAPGRVMAAMSVQVAASIALAVLFSPMGLLAAAIGWLTGDVIASILMLYWATRAVGFHWVDMARVYAGPLISSLFSALAIYALWQVGIEHLPHKLFTASLSVAVYMILYLAFLRLADPQGMGIMVREAKGLIASRDPGQRS